MSQQQQQEIDDLITNLKILSKLEQNNTLRCIGLSYKIRIRMIAS